MYDINFYAHTYYVYHTKKWFWINSHSVPIDLSYFIINNSHYKALNILSKNIVNCFTLLYGE